MTSDEIKNKDGFISRWSMHYGATPKLFELAETLRGNMTLAEKILWNILKKNDWQLNFRRQHPIAIYIADFYCHKVKLAIELDDGYHENTEVKIYDETREKEIREFGISILRFKNEEIINDLENVFTKINSMIALIQKAGKDKTIPDTPDIGLAKGADCSRNSPLGLMYDMGLK